MPNTIVESEQLSSSFLSARQYLQQNNNADHQNLYSHLLTILHTALNENIPNLYENLETFSANVKKQQLKIEKLNPSKIPPSTAEIALNATILAAIQPSFQLVADANSTKIAANKTFINYHLPDLVSLSSLFAAVGLSFQEEDAVILQLSIAQLAQTFHLPTLSFWGIIYGNKQNYIIVEAPVSLEDAKKANSTIPKTVKKKSEIATVSRTEVGGKGTNAYRYFVTNSLTGDWKELPDVTPEMIVRTREIQSFFSGDLTRQLDDIPNYPFDEAQYLRTQIARISAATHLSPKGALTVDEDEEIGERVIQDDSWEGFDITNGKELENWVHIKKKILKNGRCEAFVPPEVEEVDEEEEEPSEDAEEESEEPLPLLGSLDADEFPSYPSFQPYRIRSSQLNPTHPHAICSVWSNTWPGAVSLAHHSETVNVYFGFGQKYLPSYFTPSPIVAMAKEWTAPIDEEEENEDVNRCEEQTDPQPPEEEEHEEEDQEEENEDEED